MAESNSPGETICIVARPNLIDQEDSGYVMRLQTGERVEFGLKYKELRKGLRSRFSSGAHETTARPKPGPFVSDTKPYANLQAVLRELGVPVYYLRRTQLVEASRQELGLKKSADADLDALLHLWTTQPSEFKQIIWAEEDFLADAKDILRMKLDIQRHRNKTKTAELLGRDESARFHEKTADTLDSLLGKRVRKLEKQWPFLPELKVPKVSTENALNLIAEAGLPHWFTNEWKWLAYLGLTDRYSITRTKILRKEASKAEIQWLEIHKPIHAAAMRPFSGTYGAETKRAVDEILAVAESSVWGETTTRFTRPPLHKRQAVNRVATHTWTEFWRKSAPVTERFFSGRV